MPQALDAMPPDYSGICRDALNRMISENRYRVFSPIARPVGSFPQAHIGAASSGETGDPTMVFCSNDYLLMGHHPAVLSAMSWAIDAFGAGAGGTRNIAGTHPLHQELESELACLHRKDSALLFACGYLANYTTLSTLGSFWPDTLILSDERNHASMIEGMIRSRCEKRRFRHNNVDDLRRLLAAEPIERPKIVAFESVYSMDGDIAPVADICSISREFGAFTFLDEVHAVGLYGPQGAGVAAAEGVADAVDVIQGTLAKAYGVSGGYIAGHVDVVDFVRSAGAGFIFTTAVSPCLAAGALASIRELRDRGDCLRSAMVDRVKALRDRLTEANIPYQGNPSHITLVMIGDAGRAKSISTRLESEFGVFVQAINYPTVAQGSERLRVTVTPQHTDEILDQFVDALSVCWRESHLDASEGLG